MLRISVGQLRHLTFVCLEMDQPNFRPGEIYFSADKVFDNRTHLLFKLVCTHLFDNDACLIITFNNRICHTMSVVKCTNEIKSVTKFSSICKQYCTTTYTYTHG